jgi:hypothetical protein
MLNTKGKTEKFKGCIPSLSPGMLQEGIFSLCSGGVPLQGSFGRIPGKYLRDSGSEHGGVISIYQFGKKIAVQRFVGMEIYDITTLAPTEENNLFDSEGNLVYDNEGIPILV